MKTYVMRDENSRALGAKPSWEASLMWCARCHADLAPSRGLIPVFHIIFRADGSGPKPKSGNSTATSLLPAKPDPLLPAKPDPPPTACSQRSQIVREVRVSMSEQ